MNLQDFLPTPLSNAVIQAVDSCAAANPTDPACTAAEIALDINLRAGRPTKSGAVLAMIDALVAVGALIRVDAYPEPVYVAAIPVGES